MLDLAVLLPLLGGPQQALVDRAVDRGVAFLRSVQERDGFWPYERNGSRADCSALCLYTLLACGVEPTDDAVARAIAKLDVEGPRGTYGVACLLLAITSHDRYDHLGWVQESADLLASWQEHGVWGYPSGADLSNTQFAAFGLRAAERYGAQVAPEVWHDLGQAVKRYRSGDGYTYSRGPTTGSMTCAGVGTLAICEEMLRRAGDLSDREAEAFSDGREAGLDWLARRFRVDRNPERDGDPHYYLYALERMGALTGVTHVGDHDWYAEGAALLVETQREDGRWGDMSGWWTLPETCFALLFLRRATRASITGDYRAARHPHFETLPGTDAAVRLTASVGEPWTVWISGFGEDVLRELEWPREKGRGPHVSRVVYLVDGAPAAEIVGDPENPAEHERFPFRHEFVREGQHTIAAVVHAQRPLAEGGIVTLRSPALTVEVEHVTPAFWREALDDRGRDVLTEAHPHARATSAFDDRRAADEAVDGKPRTAWLAAPDDERPVLSIELARPTEARVVVLAHARTKPHRPGYFARALEVEVTINGREVHRVRMPYDERRSARLVLEEPVRVSRLDVALLLKVPGEREEVGLSEVRLLR